MISIKNFTSIMPRDRFFNILTFLHTTDNAAQPPRDDPNHDTGYKVSNIAALLVRKWQHHYTPDKEVSIDETLVPFKGRSKYKQYIPSKPHKWGIKVWTLAESKTGYVSNWDLYRGQLPNDGTNRTATHRIVMKACQPILDKGYHIYCDNFFTSPNLFQELADHQTGACGTLRVNRTGVPRDIKTGKPVKGEPAITHRDNKHLYIAWMDKRQVNVLTTVHNDSSFTRRVRSKFNPDHYKEMEQPKAISLYTQYMAGVDISDQQTSYNMVSHRMLKWWKKVFICNLLEVCMANTKVIYKQLRGNAHVNAEQFRLNVISGLLEGYARPQRSFSRPTSNPPSRLTERHFPSLNQHKTPAGRQSKPDCEVCSNRELKQRHQTQHMCATCDMPMCVYPCFERYHTMVNYKILCTPELHK